MHPSEAFRFLYGILCADRFTSWNKAVPTCQLLVRGLEEGTEVRGDGDIVIIAEEQIDCTVTCSKAATK